MPPAAAGSSFEILSVTDIFGSVAAVPLSCGIGDQISQICPSSPRLETKRAFQKGGKTTVPQKRSTSLPVIASIMED